MNEVDNNELKEILTQIGLYIGIIASFITIIIGIKELFSFFKRKSNKNLNQSSIELVIESKQRHILTSLSIVVMFVMSLLVSLLFSFIEGPSANLFFSVSYSTDANYLLSHYFFSSIYHICFSFFLLSALLLWKYKRLGFWLFITSEIIIIINCIINRHIFDRYIYNRSFTTHMHDPNDILVICFMGVACTGLLFVSLLLRKKGKSCWNLMENSIDLYNNRKVFFLFFLYLSLPFIVNYFAFVIYLINTINHI